MYKDEVLYRKVQNGMVRKNWTSGEDNILSDAWKCHPTYRCQVPFLLRYVDGVVVHRVKCPDTGDRPAIQPL
jgi:hypothetical protein